MDSADQLLNKEIYSTPPSATISFAFRSDNPEIDENKPQDFSFPPTDGAQLNPNPAKLPTEQ